MSTRTRHAPPELVLVGEGFSPWTEKALWALDHHGIEYRYEEYTPLLSEPWLRIRARRARGLISVPFLLGHGTSIGDSLAIAREADRIGGGPSLFPRALDGEIVHWNELADRLMRAGRAQILARTEEREDVRIESLPAHVPRPLRGLLAGGVRIGTAHLRRKYAVRPVADEELESDLARVRAALADRRYLLEDFSFADIAVASALQAVRPHRNYPAGLGSAQRDAWARTELAVAWQDLLTWRDRMIEAHRAVRLIA